MRKALAIATIAYAIIMIFCATLFLVQRSIVYGNHIDPNRSRQSQFHQVQIRDKHLRGIRRAEIRFIDDHAFTNALRMGDELEETSATPADCQSGNSRFPDIHCDTAKHQEQDLAA